MGHNQSISPEKQTKLKVKAKFKICKTGSRPEQRGVKGLKNR